MKKSILIKISALAVAVALLLGLAPLAPLKDKASLLNSPILGEEEVKSGPRQQEEGLSKTPEKQLFAVLPRDALVFDNIIMKIDDTEVVANSPDLISVKPLSVVTLDYAWRILDTTSINVGDVYNFSLPPSFKIGLLNPVNLIDPSDGSVIAIMTVTENLEVSIEFTNSVFLEKNNKSGSLHFEIKFSDEVTSTSGRQTIDYGENLSVEVIVDNGFGDEPISKSVNIAPEDNKNIIWTIDFNKGFDEYTQAKITDILPSGLTIIDAEVFYIKINPTTGQITKDISTTDFNISFTDKNLTLTANGPINKGYQAIVTTRVDSSIFDKSFTNQANFSGINSMGENKSFDTSATIAYSRDKFDFMSKKGELKWVQGTAKIFWTIRYNYSGELVKSSFSDLLSGDLESAGTGIWKIDEDSYKVWEVEPTGSTTEINAILLPSSDFNVTTINKFNTQWIINGGSFSEKSYKIEYSITVDSLANITEDGSITNTVTADNDKNALSKVNIHPFDGKAGITKVGSINPARQMISWNITFNNKYPESELLLTNAVIKDIIPEGNGIYSLDYNSIKLTKINDGTVVDESLYTVTQDSSPLGFTLAMNPNEKLLGGHRITFTTLYDLDYVSADFNGRIYNNSTLNYGGGEEQKSNVSVPTDEVFQNNGKKTALYNKSENKISWELFVNYNNYQIDEMIVTDTLEPDQELIVDSILVYTVKYTGKNIAKNTLIPSSEYTVTQGNSGFILKFNNPINRAYAIVYKSKPVGIIRPDGLYTNSAKVDVKKAGISKETTFKASINIPDFNHFAQKTGVRTDNIISWRVVINPNQSEISNGILEDVLSELQQFKRGSFKLFNAEYDSDGVLVKKEGVPDTDYKIELWGFSDGNGEKLELRFINNLAKITKPYIFEYQQHVVKPTSPNATGVSNHAKLKGQSEVLGEDDPVTIKIDFASGEGTGGGFDPHPYDVSIGGIVWFDPNKDGIRKDEDLGIANVTIILTDKDGNVVLDIYGDPVLPVKTNSNGKYLFINLPALKDGEKYITKIDLVASKEALIKYTPTLSGMGGVANGSKEWTDSTQFPKNPGDKFLSLDYGFILKNNGSSSSSSNTESSKPEPPTLEPPTLEPPIITPIFPDSSQSSSLSAKEDYSDPDINPETGGGSVDSKDNFIKLAAIFLIFMLVILGGFLIKKFLEVTNNRPSR